MDIWRSTVIGPAIDFRCQGYMVPAMISCPKYVAVAFRKTHFFKFSFKLASVNSWNTQEI